MGGSGSVLREGRRESGGQVCRSVRGRERDKEEVVWAHSRSADL